VNLFENGQIVVNEALRRLENNLVLAKMVNRQYDSSFGKNNAGQPSGVTINVRKPHRYIGRTGQQVQPEGIKDRLVPMTINTQFGVDLEITSAEEALDLWNFGEQVLEPAVATIANKIDYDGLQAAYLDVPMFVGTPGVTPTDLGTYIDAGVLLTNEAVPRGRMRHAVLSAQMEGTLVNQLKALQNNPSKISSQFDTAEIGRIVGLNFNVDQNVATHTVGPLGGTPLVNGADQIGSSLITDGWTAAAALRLRKGDVITIDDVLMVNPMSRQAVVGQKRMFVVTADVSSDASGNATIPIYPEIITSGAYQTVNAAPANNAPIQIFGHASSHASKLTTQGLAFHQDFITLAMVDLMIPRGVHMAKRAQSAKLNLAIRMIQYYDGNFDKMITRLDVLYGWKVLRPEMAVRVLG
jgi:hypothetical protein